MGVGKYEYGRQYGLGKHRVTVPVLFCCPSLAENGVAENSDIARVGAGGPEDQFMML